MPDEIDDADVEIIDFTPTPIRTRKPRSSTTSVAQRASSKVATPRKGSAAAFEKQAAGTFAKLLVIITVGIAWGRIRRMGIPDPEGNLAEELSMLPEEAEPIAKVIARFTTSNATTAKIVKPLVENEDLVDAGFAIWEYNKRQSEILSQYQRTTVQEVPANNGTPRQARGSESESDGGGDGGVPEFAWDPDRQYLA
jgi:hypothetical protein